MSLQEAYEVIASLPRLRWEMFMESDDDVGDN